MIEERAVGGGGDRVGGYEDRRGWIAMRVALPIPNPHVCHIFQTNNAVKMIFVEIELASHDQSK